MLFFLLTFFFINVDMHTKYMDNKKNKSKIYEDAIYLNITI